MPASDESTTCDAPRSAEGGDEDRGGSLMARRAAVLLLLVVAGGIYAVNLDGPFIFDDAWAIVENPHIKRLWPPFSFFSGPPDSPPAGRPIVGLSLAINYAIGGEHVLGYHVFNIAVHLFCGALLYGVIGRTLSGGSLGERFGRDAHLLALLCTAVWLLHPIQSECVNYISQRTESLMAMFFLMTLYCAIRGLETGRSRWHWAAVVTCGLGMMSKEVMAVAPVMIVVYDYAFGGLPWRDVFRRRRMFYVGLASTWVILAALMFAGPRWRSVGYGLGVSTLGYALNQFIAITHYLRLMFWPDGLVLDYGYSSEIAFGSAAGPMVFVIMLVIIAAVVMVRRPMVGFLGVWFFLLLAPTSSFVPIQTEVAAERRMYLPSAAVVVLVVMLVYLALGRIRPSTAAVWRAAAVLVVVAVVLGGLTIRRNLQYRSSVAIWQSAVDVRPNNFRALNNLGLALFAERDDVDGAIGYYRRAIELEPHYEHAHHNLARALEAKGRVDESIAYCRRVLEQNPQNGKILNYLGALLLTNGQTAEAITYLRRAVAVRPTMANAHYNLGVAMRTLEHIDEAIAMYRQALRYDPYHVEAHTNLGSALQAKGQIDDAISQFRQAIAVDANYAEAHFNLGNALTAAQRLDEAIAAYRKALSIKADHVSAMTNLGVALSMQGRQGEAITYFQKVIDSDPADANAHYNLGTALNQTGKVSEGLGHLLEATKLRPRWHAPADAAAWLMATHEDAAVRRPADAVVLARRAVALTEHRDAQSFDTLAAALAATGAFEEAIAAAGTAIELADAAGQQALVGEVRRRLQLYEQKRAYVEGTEDRN